MVGASFAQEGPKKPKRRQNDAHGLSGLMALVLMVPASLRARSAQPHFNGGKAYEYAREFAAIGPRWPTGPGHVKAEEFLRDHFKHDQLEEDTFTANTPIGPVTHAQLHRAFSRQERRRDRAGVALRDQLSAAQHQLCGRERWSGDDRTADGDCATNCAAKSSMATRYGWCSSMAKRHSEHWSASDSTYGSRHLAAKWGGDGTLGRIKAFMLADMIGDKDLDIQRETRSTEWLVDLVRQAAKKFGDERYFFQTEEAVDDDHLPFVQRGVPSIDVIDLELRTQQQLSPHRAGHHGQDQRPQPGDRRRRVHGNDQAD